MNQIIALALAMACAGLIAWRVIGTVNNMNHRGRSRSYPSWLAFGLAYSVLMIAAFGSAIQVWRGEATPGDWLWLIASAGLIVFDRRHHREQGHGRSKASS